MDTAQGWIAFGLLLTALAGLVIGVAKHIYGRIADVDQQRSNDVKEIHAKIDGVKDTYVRSADLEKHLKHLEDGQRQTNHQLSQVVLAVQKLSVDFARFLGELESGKER